MDAPPGLHMHPVRRDIGGWVGVVGVVGVEDEAGVDGVDGEAREETCERGIGVEFSC